jgi:anti-anti-sigma factor
MPNVVTLSGEYDLNNKEALHIKFAALQNETDLVFDLSAVTYLDSGFLGELVRLHNARTRSGLPKETLVISRDSVVERLFGIVGVGPLFKIVTSIRDIDTCI